MHGESVQERIKAMTEVFEALAVIGDPVTEEDRVVYLLASLPDSFNMLVTALEASSENVQKMEIVTERLLHEERKMKEKGNEGNGSKAFTAGHRRENPKKLLTCHFCKKPGHFKRNCRKLAQLQKNEKAVKPIAKHSASKATTNEQVSSSTSDDEALVIGHALSATSRGNWIVDSGATCHMCNDKELFKGLSPLRKPQEVTLGDGRVLGATAKGTVTLEMLFPDGSSQRCNLQNVLYVPKLSYNLLSVSKASEARKTTKFNSSGCEIVNRHKKVVAFATIEWGISTTWNSAESLNS